MEDGPDEEDKDAVSAGPGDVLAPRLIKDRMVFRMICSLFAFTSLVFSLSLLPCSSGSDRLLSFLFDPCW